MGKVTIVSMVISTGIVLITFGKGMGLLHGGDVGSHLQWALIAVIVVLVANCFAMVHAAQSDRIIRELRRYIAAKVERGASDGRSDDPAL
jgi:hypothetical protein